MIEGLKPYPEYKASEQKWLGGVPAHWDLKPGHAAFAKRKESNRGMKEKTVLSLSYGRIKVKATDKQHGLVPESYETYQVVNEGNVIIRGTDLQNDHTSLRIGLSRNRGIISSAYLCLQALPSITPDYGYQILNVFDLTKAIYRYGSGLRQNLDHGEIKRLPIFLPPLDEQAAIVRFLDHANRKIDGFIRAKRKLIGLLNEQKQAIIHRAVTRGLHPDVPLKPSGLPWLGDIPQHWQLSPNRAFLRIRKVLVGKRHPHFTLLSLTKRGVIVRDLSEMRGKFSSDMGTSQEVRTGDLVLCLFDVPETPRTVGLSRNDGMITGAYTVLECKDQEIAQYLELFYIAMDDRKLLSPLYSGLRNTIPKERFLGAKTPIPPSHERIAILNSVKKGTATLDLTIARTEREIALMQEYRTRLTADLVTGKLDVREAAAKLPDADECVHVQGDLPQFDSTLEFDPVEDEL
jgi:type I restriction enzyme S subunit